MENRLNNPRISMNITQEGVTIQMEDSDATVTFLEVSLTPEQFTSLLAGAYKTKCEASVNRLDLLGKKHECKKFTFELPEKFNYEDRKGVNRLWLLAKDALHSEYMSEWIPDKYFGSQNTFENKGGKQNCNVIIRRWVENKN